MEDWKSKQKDRAGKVLFAVIMGILLIVTSLCGHMIINAPRPGDILEQDLKLTEKKGEVQIDDTEYYLELEAVSDHQATIVDHRYLVFGEHQIAGRATLGLHQTAIMGDYVTVKVTQIEPASITCTITKT